MIVNVAERYIKASNNNEFNFGDELAILAHLVEKFKPKAITNFAKTKGISYPAVQKRIASNKEATVVIDGVTFLI